MEYFSEFPFGAQILLLISVFCIVAAFIGGAIQRYKHKTDLRWVLDVDCDLSDPNFRVEKQSYKDELGQGLIEQINIRCVNNSQYKTLKGVEVFCESLSPTETTTASNTPHKIQYSPQAEPRELSLDEPIFQGVLTHVCSSSVEGACDKRFVILLPKKTAIDIESFEGTEFVMPLLFRAEGMKTKRMTANFGERDGQFYFSLAS